MRRWLWVLLASSVAFGQQPAGAEAEQRRLQVLGTMSREDQLAPANQAFLVAFVRRAALLYLHRLDELSCRALFGLGDEARFAAAVGSTDRTEHNQVFIEGDRSPRHEVSGPYVFPSNTWDNKYWPATPERNTYWHEVQHELMDSAGRGVEIDPAPFRAFMEYPPSEEDEHHVLIEGVGQRSSEAYVELLGFEEAARRADRLEAQWLAEGLDPSDYGLQRQAWGDAHQRFSGFLKKMKRVVNVPAASLAAYRAATGVFFASAEQVAEFYRNGGMKRRERGEALPIRPPTWVFFPDLLLMPVQVKVTDANRKDLEEPGALALAPSVTKDDVFRQAVVVRVVARGSLNRMTASAKQNREVGGTVGRGHLRVRVVEEEPLVGLAVSQGAGATVDGIEAPGGPSSRFFDFDLAAPNSQPVRVTFLRRKLTLLKKPVTYHVALEYSDPDASRLYDAASAQLSFTLGASGGGPAAPAPAGSPAPAPAAPTAPPPATAAVWPPLGVKMAWAALPGGIVAKTGNPDATKGPPPSPLPSPGEVELVKGPPVFFNRGVFTQTSSIRVEFFGRVLDKNIVTLADWIAMSRPSTEGLGERDTKRALSEFNRYRHAETNVGGLRAFESVTGESTPMQHFHHYLVELDPQRHQYLLILSFLNVRTGSTPMETLKQELATIIRGLRFTLSATPPLGLTKSPQLPVPKALTDAPIADNEIEKRPPPPPVDSNRPKRPRPPKAPPAARPPANPPPAVRPPLAPPPANPPPATPPPVKTPPVAPPPPPVAPVAPPPVAPPATRAAGSTLAGTGEAVTRGRQLAVAVANTSRQPWTRCTVVIPGRRSFSLGSVNAGFRREVLLESFAYDGSAPDLRHEMQVTCTEGSTRMPLKF